MVVNFQSWTDPLIIIMALPGAMFGVLWALFVTQTTFNVPSLMGTIMVMGLATANSILLAEIETPDVDKQKGQAVGTLSQSQANLGQARANLELARVSTERWQRLVQRNAVSKQEADTYRLQFEARQADVVAAEATIMSALWSRMDLARRAKAPCFQAGNSSESRRPISFACTRTCHRRSWRPSRSVRPPRSSCETFLSAPSWGQWSGRPARLTLPPGRF
jgi:hypothetical protein